MKKIIARELPPEHVDFRHYFDDACFTGAEGENYIIYIPGSRYWRGLNTKEYKEIVRQAENILDGFYDIREGGNDYSMTYKEVMEYNAILYSSRKCHLLKQWAKNADAADTDDIAEFLTITTGEKWNVRSFSGYAQGDYCEVMYCKKHYSEEHITEIGKFYLGCGTEFCIDDCCGYYVLDGIRWDEGEKLREFLAECYGCRPEVLEIYLYKGNHTVADYELMVG